MDGAIVVENPTKAWEYAFALCYDGEVLEHLWGTIWYEAGEDLLACIEQAEYTFEQVLESDNLIQLTPNCPSYGDTLYEYVGKNKVMWAKTQGIFNGDLHEKEILLDLPEGTLASDGYIRTSSDDWWTPFGMYIAFAVLSLLLLWGAYVLYKK